MKTLCDPECDDFVILQNNRKLKSVRLAKSLSLKNIALILPTPPTRVYNALLSKIKLIIQHTRIISFD